MGKLAFIVWLYTSPTGLPLELRTLKPDDCRAAGDRVAAQLVDLGYTDVDYFCRYTNAPATSMRPTARPVQ